MQLLALESHIAREASEDIAERYITAIIERCLTLTAFPNRGTPRPDLGETLRTLSFRRRSLIVYAVDDEAHGVVITGVFYGGQDFENDLREDR